MPRGISHYFILGRLGGWGLGVEMVLPAAEWERIEFQKWFYWLRLELKCSKILELWFTLPNQPSWRAGGRVGSLIPQVSEPGRVCNFPPINTIFSPHLPPRFESVGRLAKADLLCEERAGSPWLREEAQKPSLGSIFIHMLASSQATTERQWHLRSHP